MLFISVFVTATVPIYSTLKAELPVNEKKKKKCAQNGPPGSNLHPDSPVCKTFWGVLKDTKWRRSLLPTVCQHSTTDLPRISSRT